MNLKSAFRNEFVEEIVGIRTGPYLDVAIHRTLTGVNHSRLERGIIPSDSRLPYGFVFAMRHWLVGEPHDACEQEGDVVLEAFVCAFSPSGQGQVPHSRKGHCQNYSSLDPPVEGFGWVDSASTRVALRSSSSMTVCAHSRQTA